MAGADANISGVAGRYASALFDLAKDAGAIDAVAADLAGLDEHENQGLVVAQNGASGISEKFAWSELYGIGLANDRVVE